MSTLQSKDGTTIAYDRAGSGPAVILVDGALCYRGFGPMLGLASLLAPHFTVYTYDRRGRGESGDTQPYSLEREVDDLEALIQAAGNSVYLCGLSSGGALVLEAASRLGSRVRKIAIYEAPYREDGNTLNEWKEYTDQLGSLLAAGRRGDAVILFMRLVETPAGMIDGMAQSPMWPVLEAVAPTLAYDAAALGKDRCVPVERAAVIQAPALVMNGGAGFPFMKDTAEKLARAIPHARHQILKDQRHDVNNDVLAPVLVEFFGS